MKVISFLLQFFSLIPRWWIPGCAAILLSLVSNQVALAKESQARPTTYPIDLHHTSWTAKDGAPPNIFAMAQTPDGWLWLASTSGIFRFDGVKFERFHPKGEQLRSNNIWGLHLLASGALWIGYRTGGASVVQHGEVRNFGQADGLPVASVIDFEEDASSRVWAATSRGLRMFDGKHWQTPAQQFNAPRDSCTFLRDDKSNLWAQCESGVFELSSDAQQFVKKTGPAGHGRLVQGPDKTVWTVGGPNSELVALEGPGVNQPKPAWPLPRMSGGTIFFDRDAAHVWVTRADGLVRVNQDGSNEIFGIAQGLSGAIPNCILQDVEGNVWVGTENGLDRFRKQALSGVSLPQIFGDSAAIAAGSDGALWVSKTMVPKPERAAFADIPKEDANNTVTVLWRESKDSLWIGGHDGLWHQHGDQMELVPLPNDVHTPQIHSIVRDRDGDLWISIRKYGVFKLHNGIWEAGGGFAELTGLVTWLYRDKDGRMWFSFMDGRIALLSAGKLRQFGTADGLFNGATLQILSIDNGIWIAGENGVFHFDGTRFQRILGAGEDELLGVSGMLQLDGTLWLNGMAGITAIDIQELKRAISDPAYRVHFHRFDHKDGLQGIATPLFPVPSAVAGDNNVLWFSTTAGIFSLDIAKLPRNPIPPPVYIRSITSNGVAHTVEEGAVIRLRPHPGRLQIDYTALSLTMPERMQFFFQLEGVDTEWQDAGTSRTAIYTDLAPGEYQFRVKAANNDGVWNNTDAVVRLYIEPAMYQTKWFRVLCATVLVLTLWGLYKLRLAQVANKVRERMEERLHERERISRELHDTFLQTVAGLILKIHAVFQRLPADDPAKDEMKQSLDLAERALNEGRDRVRGLRFWEEQQPDLANETCVAVSAAYPSASQLLTQSSGIARRFYPGVYEELSAIMREAAINAIRHAEASQIVLEVDYGNDAFVMAITDNGRGITSDIQDAGHRIGHYGMIGMRERASRIRATLSLTSNADSGTCWRVVLPAKLAYEAV